MSQEPGAREPGYAGTTWQKKWARVTGNWELLRVRGGEGGEGGGENKGVTRVRPVGCRVMAIQRDLHCFCIANPCTNPNNVRGNRQSVH